MAKTKRNHILFYFAFANLLAISLHFCHFTSQFAELAPLHTNFGTMTAQEKSGDMEIFGNAQQEDKENILGNTHQGAHGKPSLETVKDPKIHLQLLKSCSTGCLLGWEWDKSEGAGTGTRCSAPLTCSKSAEMKTHEAEVTPGFLDGLFFYPKINEKYFNESPFGDTRLAVNAATLFDRNVHNAYFADVYCFKSGINYITIVVCTKSDRNDKWCKEHLIPVFMHKRNPFIWHDPKTGIVYGNGHSGIRVEIYYTGSLKIRGEMLAAVTYLQKRRASLPYNMQCTQCNLHQTNEYSQEGIEPERTHSKNLVQNENTMAMKSICDSSENTATSSGDAVLVGGPTSENIGTVPSTLQHRKRCNAQPMPLVCPVKKWSPVENGNDSNTAQQ